MKNGKLRVRRGNILRVGIVYMATLNGSEEAYSRRSARFSQKIIRLPDVTC